jgi:isopenicillin-N N-acyltransferase-like protein
VWDVETSATSFAFFVGGDRLVHTNHYLAPEMALHESACSPGSRARLARAEALLGAGIARGDDPRELVGAVLADHEGIEDGTSICCHPDESAPVGVREMTTASVIWDLGEQTVEVCAGPPCGSGRRLYRL